MTKSPTSLRGLLWYPATLAIWLAISCAALVSSDVKTAIAGIIALALIAALSLIFQSTSLVSLVCGITLAFFGYYLHSLYGIQNISLYALLTFSAAAVGTAIIAWQTRKQIAISNRQVERDRMLIEELRINDTKTGLMRFHYARRTLMTEISRSLRYGKSLALLIIRIGQWDELAEEIGMDARENLLVTISEILFDSFRNVDTLFLNIDKIGVILPETSEEGAKVVAKRVIEQVNKKTRVKLFMGIACFPTDSVADEELIRKGELALKSAVQSGQEVFSYSQIQVVDEDNPGEVLVPNTEENFPNLQLNHIVDDQGGKIPDEEIIINFKGIKNLTEIEPIQKALGQMREFETVRLVNFHENELVFSIKTSIEDIQSVLNSRLQLPVDRVIKVDDAYQVFLDSNKSNE